MNTYLLELIFTKNIYLVPYQQPHNKMDDKKNFERMLN